MKHFLSALALAALTLRAFRFAALRPGREP